ncbi:MAG: glycosyltransferase family 9 protein [Planctomycetota bacterium]
MPDPSVSAPKRILLIRPSALGDVCRTVPVLVSLKRRWPEAEIDWLVQDTFAPAITSHPDLHEAIPFQRKRFAKLHHPGTVAAFFRWLKQLRGRDYDLALDCQGLFRSGFIAWRTGAVRRVGDRNARELGWLFLNERHTIDPSLHTVDRMLSLAEAAGAPAVREMSLHTSIEARGRARAKWPWLTERPVVLAPTSRWASKRWPADRFAALARDLLDQGTNHIAVVGGPGEEEQCQPLIDLAAANSRTHALVGKTPIEELLCVIESASLVVANDSAALHMAVGFERPTVALFGPTDTGQVGPYRMDDDVIQMRYMSDVFDHKNDANVRMMERIDLTTVRSACLRKLRQ